MSYFYKNSINIYIELKMADKYYCMNETCNIEWSERRTNLISILYKNIKKEEHFPPMFLSYY